MPDWTPTRSTVPCDNCVGEIAHSVELFHQAGETIEVRVLGIPGRGKPHSASGYFRDFDTAARAAADIESRNPTGIYFVVNQVDPQCYFRTPDKVTDYVDTTTSDGNILRRRWLYIDVDPKRPSGVSSTQQQLSESQRVAEEIHDWMMAEMGLPEPIHAMSGNGWHLHFPIDLPNDIESLRMVSGVLETLQQFNSDRAGVVVNIDKTTSNAARICRLYGTMACKGTHTTETPHRRSQLVFVPDCIGSVYREWQGG